MFTNKHYEFLKELKNKEYREAFMEEIVGTSLAFQVRRLREARDWTQEHLATRTGKAQETISQWENPNYGKYSLTTLKQLAAAFDVALLVRFVSFGELADWVVDVAPERQTPPSYEEEYQLPFWGDTNGQLSGSVEDFQLATAKPTGKVVSDVSPGELDYAVA